jgi:hypothetical protein
MNSVRYLHLPAGQPLPTLSFNEPFKAVLVIEDDVEPEWQAAVSEWLVRARCHYMMAWGRKCSEWDDSVDYAAIDVFGDDASSDDSLVMTTWHDKEPLSEPFWFSEHSAFHPTIEMPHTLILHIAPQSQEAPMLVAFERARNEVADP